ncbi:helix-turn-helix transcriptional regulator [Nocardioides sp. CN2-186]|uniref:helix-turn-helix domain-containing protein n=1 Tax=Nocardioides tweenelious TaxID=3156607 RepID=UPI0032B34741
MYASESAQRALVEHLCSNLASLRKARSLTQAELAEASGITRNHYQLLESGRTATGELANPRLSTLIALAGGLEVEAPSLLLAPVPHTVWRWVEVGAAFDETLVERLLDRLLTTSSRELDGGCAAFVGIDGDSLSLGLAVLAPSPSAALVVGSQHIIAALAAVGVNEPLDEGHEVTAGIEGLARADET